MRLVHPSALSAITLAAWAYLLWHRQWKEVRIASPFEGKNDPIGSTLTEKGNVFLAFDTPHPRYLGTYRIITVSSMGTCSLQYFAGTRDDANTGAWDRLAGHHHGGHTRSFRSITRYQPDKEVVMYEMRLKCFALDVANRRRSDPSVVAF